MSVSASELPLPFHSVISVFSAVNLRPISRSYLKPVEGSALNIPNKRAYRSEIVIVRIRSPGSRADPGSRGDIAKTWSIPSTTRPKTG